MDEKELKHMYDNLDGRKKLRTFQNSITESIIIEICQDYEAIIDYYKRRLKENGNAKSDNN